MNPSPDGWYRVTCERYTCGMVVASGIVADAAPIIRKHIGLPIAEAVTKIREKDHDVRIIRRGDLEEL
jgi:hypothetical protein